MATTSNIAYGSKGDDVKALQQTLIDAGYDLGKGGADGIFGKDTQAAVEKYQKDNNLAVDGIVGKNTSAALANTQSTASAGTQTNAAQPVQQPQQNVDVSALVSGAVAEALAPYLTQQKQSSSTDALLAAMMQQQQAQQQAQQENAKAMTEQLNQWLETAKTQQNLAADYATQQGITELQRAQEDAKLQYQTQRNQIDIDEAKAKDNQALYAETRGDKGGIGAAQYSSIMNTAAQNRLSVNNAQTKLATDTARQIADLRVQGEYQKADALLQLSQQYLSQLMSLSQWSMEYGLSVSQFNAQLQQWLLDYKTQQDQIIQDNKYQEAALTGKYNGELTLQGQQQANNLQDQLASTGMALLNMGMPISESQRNALGLTESDVADYLNAYKLSNTKGGGTDGVVEHMISLGSDIKAYEYLAGLGLKDSVYDKFSDLYESNKPADDKALIEEASNMTVDDLSSEGRTLLDTIRRSYSKSGKGDLPDSALNLLDQSKISDLEKFCILFLLGYDPSDYL